MKSAITITLVPETRTGPFVFSHGLADGFGRAAELGFDAVEIFPESAAATNGDEVATLCASHGLRVAAVGTGAGWVKHRLRLTDADPAIRRRAIDFVAEIVALAARFGAPAIIGSMQGRAEEGVSREQAMRWLVEALNELGPRAELHGTPLLYEFLNRYETNLCNTVAESLALLDRLETANVRLLCDLFHMNIEEPDLAAALRRAGARVGHVHFADSNRRAAGLGHTNFDPVIAALREIGYAGYLSAEVLALPDAATAAAQTMASFRRLTGPRSS
jgi:sugar phosphate isomerase/epimerase